MEFLKTGASTWLDFLFFGATDSLLALIFCHAPSPLFTQYTYHDRVFTPLKNRLQVRRANRLRTLIKNISV